MIEDEASKFPRKIVRIYCGHGHSSGYYETANIKCWTAGARYGYPEIHALIEIEP
jgi:hypothetical protein